MSNPNLGLGSMLAAQERKRLEAEARAKQAAQTAEASRMSGIEDLRKKKNSGRRDRFGRRMTFDGETVLGGRVGLDEATTARFGATPTGGKTVLGV